VAQSILTSTKKMLGLLEDDTSFDLDIMLHINSVLAVLNQVGIGPEEGFTIEDSAPTWEAFVGTDKTKSLVKSYVYLKVRLLFDPPATSFAIESFKEQIGELEWRLNVNREGESWTSPFPLTA
jgi:hypothetical protein